jgi:hypothetical protein
MQRFWHPRTTLPTNALRHSCAIAAGQHRDPSPPPSPSRAGERQQARHDMPQTMSHDQPETEEPQPALLAPL